ncbi:hypothetical protein C8R46DRAFT_1081370 [Mycena filopes]|nr:hypothetical protein C8R46DRAFT_1081370 [Mycena filopes]
MGYKVPGVGVSVRGVGDDFDGRHGGEQGRLFRHRVCVEEKGVDPGLEVVMSGIFGVGVDVLCIRTPEVLRAAALHLDHAEVAAIRPDVVEAVGVAETGPQVDEFGDRASIHVLVVLVLPVEAAVDEEAEQAGQLLHKRLDKLPLCREHFVAVDEGDGGVRDVDEEGEDLTERVDGGGVVVELDVEGADCGGFGGVGGECA